MRSRSATVPADERNRGPVALAADRIRAAAATRAKSRAAVRRAPISGPPVPRPRPTLPRRSFLLPGSTWPYVPADCEVPGVWPCGTMADHAGVRQEEPAMRAADAIVAALE